jgi:hypothetical protein
MQRKIAKRTQQVIENTTLPFQKRTQAVSSRLGAKIAKADPLFVFPGDLWASWREIAVGTKV